MKLRYITLSNKKRYLIWTPSYIVGSSDLKPNKYVSYITPQEFLAGKTASIHDIAIGYVRNGSYTGIIGTYTDANGNRYNISFNNGTVTVKTNSSTEASYTGDCIVNFFATFDEDGRYGLEIRRPWNNGTYISAGSGYAFACTYSESTYNALMGEYGTRNNKNIGYIDSAMNGKITISNINNYNAIGIEFICGNTTTASSTTYADGPGIDRSTTEEDTDDDPYNDDDESGEGGGDGDHDDTSDDVGIPDLPDLSAVDTGFVTLYNPSIVEMRNLSSYMWSNAFDLNNFKKMFADPMDAIIGLSIVPVNVPAGSSQSVQIGNINTGVSMTKAASQYVEVDCGSLVVNKYWGAYLDYDPFTKFELFLPYIGTRAISADDVMGKTVTIKYHVDILSGALVAFVKCGDSVIYSFEGQCSCAVPVANIDWTNSIKAAIDIAAKLGSAAGQAYTNPVGAVGDVASAASSVESLKPSIEKSGSIGGMGGQLGIQKPYFIITRPRQAVPGNQNNYQGYPAFITKNLTELSGYTEVDSIILDYISASDEEKDEIMSLLKGGVIL